MPSSKRVDDAARTGFLGDFATGFFAGLFFGAGFFAAGFLTGDLCVDR